jgi:hypothetical protein
MAVAPPLAQPPVAMAPPPPMPPVAQPPMAAPPMAAMPAVQPPAAQPAQRQPSTPSDPGNAGGTDNMLAGIQDALNNNSAKMEELEGLILGTARTQRVLGILLLEVAQKVLDIPKPALIKMVEKAQAEGEPEKFFEGAQGKS